MEIAPLAPDEESRLKALYSLNILDSPAEERFDNVTRLAADIFQTPIAYVAMVDLNRQWFKSRVGVNACETGRDISFCSHAILSEETLIIPDTQQDPRFADSPLVTGDPFIRFYAGQPLRGPGDRKIGTFCIADSKPRELTAEQIRVLKELAGVVERELKMTDVIHLQAELLATQGELIKAQRHLQEDQAEAVRYVQSLLPPPLKAPFSIDWRFQPSDALGGDCFGYHDLGDGRYAIYLLDVCGHGVRAAFLSVTLLNLLRSQTLSDVDFGDPAAVLNALNREFPMIEHGNMYFTMWYGVLDLASRQLTFASGGHPPAVLVLTDQTTERLKVKGAPVGCSDEAIYTNAQRTIGPGEILYVFSDGAYELRGADGDLMPFSAFAELLSQAAHRSAVSLDYVIATQRRRAGVERFPDDVSVLEVRLP